ncbi:hypothetical protein Rs2_26790 [Raphanus sativus]|uniref:Cyclin-dependent protein kinase inhibitor SMR13-like n=1 Tax=Raphanus sativus TaxID=3726 RepID=A0A6J0LFH3_RAPSA|nr:cyclin-dependent protein kinase inhibitor SMR13-like [Raphanus sativus]KAJ4887042.1 hypothetical protein Rs2_26790 [Raphanus sativus]
MPSKKATKPTRAKKKLKRTHVKKPLLQPKDTLPDHTSSSSIVSSCSSTATSFSHQDPNKSIPSPSPAVLTLSSGEGDGSGGCCTPKAYKYRIPEMLICPPAPKKQRVPQNCVLRRRQIVFFAPPEIELFFVRAHDI